MRSGAASTGAVLVLALVPALAARPAAAVQASPDAPATAPVSAVDSLLARGLIQEAAWAARAAGDTARSDSLVARLDAILRSRPRTARPMGMDSQGVSYTFRLAYDDGVEAVFKVDGSDVFCRECGAEREVAAYRIDRLLGFGLTPVTVFQAIVVDGDTLRGSAMYFVRDATVPGRDGEPKPDRLRFLDAVLGNSDRHEGNWLRSSDGAVVAIDHNRALEYRPTATSRTCWETEVDSIARVGELGRPWERYRALPADSLRAAVADVLDAKEAEQLVGMRARVVRRILARIERPDRQLPLRDCDRPG